MRKGDEAGGCDIQVVKGQGLRKAKVKDEEAVMNQVKNRMDDDRRSWHPEG